jgi:hypothetical protein
MSLENFAGFDQNDGMDAASFEKFKEKMKRAAAQIKAIKKEEKKRKKKEDELVKILLKFIQTSHKRDLVLVISRALEQNLPANFILAIVLLGNEDIQKEIGKYLMLKGPENQAEEEKSLTFFREDKTLPLKIKIEIDQWIKNLIYQASESPQKLLQFAYDVVEVEVAKTEDEDSQLDSQFGETKTEKTKIISPRLVQLMAHVIFDFLKQNDIEEDITKLKEFSEFLAKGILNKTQEELGNRPKLEGGGATKE